ncbi:hypothetical protein CLAIMM_03131 [Cladophialophora immunda]|nr:hypothetical protein CLAIMM_03131 [Cladophialophora immunda]
MQTAFRPRDNLTLPLPSPRHGDFSRQVKREPTSGYDAGNETPGDLVITVTVERVVHSFQDSIREAITGDGLCPSGRLGPRTSSWFSPVVARTIYDQYTVVRFHAGHGPVTLRDLDQVAKSLSSVTHIMQLNNGRWEMLVWKGCITELKGRNAWGTDAANGAWDDMCSRWTWMEYAVPGRHFQASIHASAWIWGIRLMRERSKPAIEILLELLDPNLGERAARGMYSSSTVASAGLYYFIGAGSVLVVALCLFAWASYDYHRADEEGKEHVWGRYAWIMGHGTDSPVTY